MYALSRPNDRPTSSLWRWTRSPGMTGAQRSFFSRLAMRTRVRPSSVVHRAGECVRRHRCRRRASAGGAIEWSGRAGTDLRTSACDRGRSRKRNHDGEYESLRGAWLSNASLRYPIFSGPLIASSTLRAIAWGEFDPQWAVLEGSHGRREAWPMADSLSLFDYAVSTCGGRKWDERNLRVCLMSDELIAAGCEIADCGLWTRSSKWMENA
jgi:hypothetical protein